jgi:hypothetical protein
MKKNNKMKEEYTTDEYRNMEIEIQRRMIKEGFTDTGYSRHIHYLVSNSIIPEILIEISKFAETHKKGWNLNWKLSENRMSPLEVLERCANDMSYYDIRYHVVEHQNVSIDLLKKLCKDPSERVKNEASRKLADKLILKKD